MKKSITYIITSIFLCTGFSSCSDFLTVTPVGRTDIPTLFSDIQGIRAATSGTYASVFSYYNSFFYRYPEVAGNMVQFSATNAEMLEQYNFTSVPEDLSIVNGIWKDIAYALANANAVLYYHPDILKDYKHLEDELISIKAEMLFLRALCHFDLCRVYAQPYNYTPDASHLGIPILKSTPTFDENRSRSSTKEVYQVIIDDLIEAIALFENTTYQRTNATAKYASKEACCALLSRVYLYMGNWDNAISYSSQVIDRIPLSKGDEYLRMFSSTHLGEEAIFRLDGLKQRASQTSFYGSAQPRVFPADTLIKLLHPDDIRLHVLTDNKNEDGVISVYPVCRKFTVPINATEDQDINNPIVLRCSEIYLNRAEAYLNKGELAKAATDVKEIIARALQKQVSEISLPETDKEALTHIIEVERAKELCFEGHQLFDITRRKQDLVRDQHTNSTVKYLPYPNDRFVLPIPQRELGANPNMQPNPTINN